MPWNEPFGCSQKDVLSVNCPFSTGLNSDVLPSSPLCTFKIGKYRLMREMVKVTPLSCCWQCSLGSVWQTRWLMVFSQGRVPFPFGNASGLPLKAEASSCCTSAVQQSQTHISSPSLRCRNIDQAACPTLTKRLLGFLMPSNKVEAPSCRNVKAFVGNPADLCPASVILSSTLLLSFFGV